MKKIGMFLVVLAMFGFMTFAENGVAFASDSTYVATLNADSLGLAANPNASMTVKLAPFTLVSTANASFDFVAMDFTSVTFAQKVDVVLGHVEVYVTPTLDFLNDFSLTLPSEVIVSKVVPFTTFTLDTDVMGFVNGSWAVKVTAEVVF